MRFRPLLSTGFAVLAAGALAAEPAAADRAFEAFWKASGGQESAAAIRAVAEAGVDFDAAWKRLKAGRPYSEAVDIAQFEWTTRTSDGFEHRAFVEVPPDYEPAKRYRVVFCLHGGVNTSDAKRGAEDADFWSARFGGDDWIVVSPFGWRKAVWWTDSQQEHFRKLLDRLKRTYNVDENRVFLTGFSDGGTGTFFTAYRDPTPWAAFAPLHGHPGVLARSKSGVKDSLPAVNLANKPLWAFGGENDPVYPASTLAPAIEKLKREGADASFTAVPKAAHDLNWPEKEIELLRGRIAGRARDPLPDRLVWEAASAEKYNRCHWLVIDALSGDGPGRVELEREGNTVTARTRGVKRFTLLLSPDRFDFDKPIRVVVDGKVAFDTKVTKDLNTLLDWAARDNDRTMLFGAQLPIEIGHGVAR